MKNKKKVNFWNASFVESDSCQRTTVIGHSMGSGAHENDERPEIQQ